MASRNTSTTAAGSTASDGAAGTRARLLESAGPIFAEKGRDGATVREICERAGVNVASINYHFGDKESLYVEVVRHARRQRETAYPYPDESQTAPDQWLARFVEALLRRLMEPGTPWQVRLLMREVLEPTSACATLVDDYFRPDFDRLLHVIRQIAGPNEPASECRRMAMSVVGQCVFYRVSEHILRRLFPSEDWACDDPIKPLARHIARFSLAGIRGSSRSRCEGDDDE